MTKMIRAGFTAGILAYACLGVTAGYAQQTTEQFIPIGLSPGVSGKSSFIGSVTAVDGAARTVSLLSNVGTKTLKITASTHIWLDRSKAGQSSIVGDFGDLETGRRIEVLPSGQDPQTAAWVKIEP